MSSASTSPARAGNKNIARDIAFIAVFAALIWAFSFLKIPVGSLGVPITLQTFAIGVTGFLLGPWRGFAATLLYVALGLLGLPVFAGGTGGFTVLAGPTAGYIIAFPLFALLCGIVAKRCLLKLSGVKLWLTLGLLGLVASFITIHPLGIGGLVINADLAPADAIKADMPFWPGDAIKNFAAAAVAVFVHKAFPRLLTDD
ncbi:biotin transporter BioY [Canibacter zhoujuaniae]|uniref:biotin transporter BioY n=1 Tax=Canibacter zhoujuaniae TaxID=2708343 RepID=UPI0014231900|nr:biotin transporter BioY [Canibacter zhoujuaniae]